MAAKKEKIARMIERIDAIIEEALELEARNKEALKKVHPDFQPGARNLLHYRALRSRDLRDIQKKLGHLGLSRLAKAESHVLASLYASRNILEGFISNKKIKTKRADFSIKAGAKMLNSHAKALLGYRSKGRRPRIMVTLPSEAADDYKLVYNLIDAGMNTARINCAHDGPEAWEKMIDHVRKASKKLKRNCNVAMDLGGPKIRTGAMAPGPKLVKFTPERDVLGQVINPARLWLAPEPHPTEDIPHIPVQETALLDLSEGDRLYFVDTRGKERKVKISQVDPEGCWASCYDTAYIQTGTKLYKDPERQGKAIPVGEMPPIEQKIILNTGDQLKIHRTPELGEPARFDEDGNLLHRPHISCTSSEVFDYVKRGEPILFDDGKIQGEIMEVHDGEIIVKIRYAKHGGGKLRSDKGINLPTSELKIRGLTSKDRQDLAFVTKHADVVNMSFVNTAEDVEDLIEELRRCDALNKLGVILKIETQAGFNNLTEILLTAMQMYPLGVMVARGDLAVEVGWGNMARIQEETMSLCRAAHVPDIWATQVLENLAKKGIPSRSEITDAAMAQRAECVMLNKGPQILSAVRLLDRILKDRQGYMEKNAPMLPALEAAEW